MKLYLLYLSVLFTLLSCGEKKVETAFLERKVSDSKKIAWVLKEENNSILGLSDEAIAFLKEFYSERGYKSLWIKKKKFTETGVNLSEILQQPLALGIPEKRVKISRKKSTHLVIKELQITSSLATLSHDLKYGILDSTHQKVKPFSYPKAQHFKEKIRFKASKTEQLAQEIIAWGPRDTVYQKLAAGLFTFVRQTDLSQDKNLKVPLFKKDSLGSLNLAKKSLILKGYLIEQQKDSASFDHALRSFQRDNGIKDDAVIGQTTVDALNETLIEKCRRTAVALERLRWREAEPRRYIEVNIPEYTLRFFADDTLKSVNRIIVGKFDTQTPEFDAQLRTIIAYPYWSVPFSITSKEILPDAKRNPNYFARNHMKLYKKGEEIDPLSVNWKGIRENTFPYKVIQQPGSHNSLGIIKFDFNNKYGVYFHDTPQKGLFNTVVRSYSHGCMRCESPVDLAKLILVKDENRIIPDSLDSILSRKINRPIQLRKRIPIYVVYRSVVSGPGNKLIFMRDIYRRDEKLAKVMFA
ncbi:MAG: L,D-transpeptidase family protein [Bacteroidota bacterium]